MNKRNLLVILQQVVKITPEVLPLLSVNKRILLLSESFKSQEYFLTQIKRLVRSLYGGNIGGEFIDIMSNLISGQYYDAYKQAWSDEGGEGQLPAYLEKSYQEAVANQYNFVDQYYRDIVDARIDEKPIDPLLTRAELWAHGWNTSYENATTLITLEEGGNEEWVLGATEEHCATCYALNGIVARASEWEQLNIRPKNPPNDKLECGGWRCDCERRSTNKRRSSGAYGRIEEIILVYGK